MTWMMSRGGPPFYGMTCWFSKLISWWLLELGRWSSHWRYSLCGVAWWKGHQRRFAFHSSCYSSVHTSTTAAYPEEWVIGWCIKKIVFCGRSLPGHPTVPATAKYFFLLSVFEYWWERCWSMVTSRRSKYFLGYAKSFSKVLSLSTSPIVSNFTSNLACCYHFIR